MATHIQWNSFYGLPSAFIRGKNERPLSLTLHSETLKQLPERESAAIEMIRQLGHLPEISALETEPGEFPNLWIDVMDENDNQIAVHIKENGEWAGTAAIWPVDQWRRTVEDLTNLSPLPKDLCADHVFAAASHDCWHRDIFVTMSPLLLEQRDHKSLQKINIRTPLETAKIVGLILRSRGNYTHTAGVTPLGGLSTATSSRWSFYWVLARHLLPNMWKYFSACVYSEKLRGDNIVTLGQSILIRASRALRARDLVGIQFFLPQDHEVIDELMYHFDYVGLMLAGALDAQARVAKRCYKLSGSERVSFRADNFLDDLENKGAKQLVKLVKSQVSQDTLVLIYLLRNTVHEAIPQPTLYRNMSKSREMDSFVVVPKEMSEALWTASERKGSAKRWGLTKVSDGTLLLEPYNYSLALVEEGLALINAVAGATDTLLLFPDSLPPSDFRPTLAADGYFAELGPRFDILG